MKHAVKHKTQSTTYNCGPTCLEMLLDFYGMQYEHEALDALCETSPRGGTHNGKLVEAARELGAEVVAKENAAIEDFMSALQEGNPVIVNYCNCKSGVGHFGVVKGVDEDKQALILADPKNGDNYLLTFEHFSQHWHNHSKTIHAWMMYFAGA